MRVLDEDLVRVCGTRYDRWTRELKKNRVVGIFYRGDEMDLVDEAEADDSSKKKVRVKRYNYGLGRYEEGYIKKKPVGKAGGVTQCRPMRWRTGDTPYLLEATFIDVQQGDATLVRAPDRRTILIDGEEEKFVARIMASMFPGSSEENRLILDSLIITHGDADHFRGLFKPGETPDHEASRKRIYVKIARYFHNGMVKPSGKIVEAGKKRNRKGKEKLGNYTKAGNKTYVTSIFGDPLDVPSMKDPFTDWKTVLDRMLLDPARHVADSMPEENLPRVERLSFGDHGAFDLFRKGGVDNQVIGPLVHEVDGKPALEFLRGESGIGASHTINGHSVVLRMRMGNVRFLPGGDLNTHSQERSLEKIHETDGLDLRSEILKVPHHGAHKFDYDFLREVSPVVSIVSSGDENAMNEYVHPRANLMAAPGYCSREPRPLVFGTKLAAFFSYRGEVQPEQHRDDGEGGLEEISRSRRRGKIHASQRRIHGSVRFESDGERGVVAVESANDGVKEAYAFTVNAAGKITPQEVTLL